MLSRILTAGKFLLPALALTVLALANAPTALANHTVYLEGNCAGSATTLPPPTPPSNFILSGACGDYDNDGTIGMTEDTDLDNVYGTLNGALNAVAGNGRVVIVTSGVFTDTVNGATNAVFNIALGTGNVQIEAANGVDATIDAVVAGGGTNNTFRQQAIGLLVSGASGSSVTLRNLVVRNWLIGMRMIGAVRVKVEGCHFDNNRDYGVQVGGSSRITMNDSEIAHTGHRQGGDPNPNPGTGIQFLDTSGGYLYDTVIMDSTGYGIDTIVPVTICHVVLHDNILGNTKPTMPTPLITQASC